MDADVVGDLLARERRSDAPALVAGDRSYDYRRFCTSAWKVGNFLRHLGVRHDTTVGVAGAGPEPLLGFLGAALLGAGARFDPPAESGARAVLAPVEQVGVFDAPPGTTIVGYGGAPADPTVAHFERDVWSENPTEPPDAVSPDDVALVADGGEYDHAALLAAARRVVDEWGLDAGERVAVRAPLSRPGTVVGGVLAPLVAGAVVCLPDEEAVCEYAVASGDAPEDAVLAPAAVSL